MADYDPDRLLSEPAPTSASMKVRPTKLSRDEAENIVRKYNPDITKGAVQGEVDNLVRESGLNFANSTGDGGTSGGGYQHHLARLKELKSFAAQEGKPWTDPETQVKFARKEKERDYPALLHLQQTVDDRNRNEDAFKRIFEKPASVLWGNDAKGQPVLGNDRYRFSDHAMREHDGRKDTDMLMMSPGEYLDLAPELSGKPFESPSGRSLMKSFDRGEPIEAVPTLDVKMDGPTARVTDQDGRHRALLAQQEGIEAIPVAVRKSGQGEPKEIVGMNGVPMAHDFPKASEYVQRQGEQPARSPLSLVSQARADEPKRDAAGNPVDADPWSKFTKPTEDAQPAKPADPWARFTGQEPEKSGYKAPGGEPGFLGGVKAAVSGAAKGLGQTVLGAQELAGEGMKAVGIPGGEWLTQDARSGIKNLNEQTKPAEAAHPYAAGAGDIAGGMIVPGGIAAKAVAPVNALRAGAAAGGVAALMAPGDPKNYWGNKALSTAVGAGAGAAAAKGGNLLSAAIKPALGAAVKSLLGQGVELTPGQMAGGMAKTVEDKLMSVPITGDAIRAARRRALESWNKAAYTKVVEPLGEKYVGNDVGFDGIATLRKHLNDHYDQVLRGTTLNMTPEYGRDLQRLHAQLLNMPDGLTPEQMNRFVTFIDQIVTPHWDATGRMSGETFKKVESILTNQAGILRRSPDQMTRNFGSAIDDLNGVLRQALADQNPDKAAGLKAANAAWARFARLRKAATQRPTDETGVFTPSDLLRAAFAGDRSAARSAFSEGRALLQDFGREGQEVMGHNVPDSGTTGRYLLYELLGGMATHPGATLAALGGQLAGAVPYQAQASKALNAAMNRLSQPAGQARNAFADLFRGGGRIAAPAAGTEGARQMQPASGP